MALLKTELKHSILHIHLDDPESRNAFSPLMAEEFKKALDSHVFKALLVSSKGPVFCSGGNLRFYKSLKNKEEGIKYNLRIAEILDCLDGAPYPKACWVDGSCFGGGMELLSCFDWICASPSSLFGLWQRRLGLTFGWGGEARLQRRINPAKLREWLLEARTLSAFDLKADGLINRISSTENGHRDVHNHLQSILALGDESLSEIFKNKGRPDEAFQNLWHSSTHLKVLSKIKS